MAEITASMVKELREKTDAPMMECKKALTEAAGDMAKAEEILRVKLGNKASKAATRVAAEGVVGMYVSDDGKLGAVVDHEAGTRADAQHFAERQGVEPVEVVAASNARVRAAKIEIAAGAGIAVSTLEDVERDLRRFVQDLTRD